MTGIDQMVGQFKKNLFEKLKQMAPPDAPDKTYEKRTSKDMRAKFDEVCAALE